MTPRRLIPALLLAGLSLGLVGAAATLWEPDSIDVVATSQRGALLAVTQDGRLFRLRPQDKVGEELMVEDPLVEIASDGSTVWALTRDQVVQLDDRGTEVLSVDLQGDASLLTVWGGQPWFVRKGRLTTVQDGALSVLRPSPDAEYAKATALTAHWDGLYAIVYGRLARVDYETGRYELLRPTPQPALEDVDQLVSLHGELYTVVHGRLAHLDVETGAAHPHRVRPEPEWTRQPHLTPWGNQLYIAMGDQLYQVDPVRDTWTVLDVDDWAVLRDFAGWSGSAGNM